MTAETIVTVVGNLTSDPELRYTQSGIAVVNLTIASTPRFFDKQTNDWKDGTTLFLRASCWREFAEHVAGSLTKGSRVIAQGALDMRSYETKEGEKRTSIELKIDTIGPDLRYATAQVTRAASSATPPTNVWASDSGTPPAGDDVWSQPGSTNDEKPF